MIKIKIAFYFLKAIVCGICHFGDKKWQIAGKELISKPTFRLKDTDSKDVFLGFRMLKRVWSDLQSQKKIVDNYDILVFDATFKAINNRLDYLLWNKNYENKTNICIGREDLVKYVNPFFAKIILVFLSMFFIPITLFSKNRVNWSLIIREYIETIGLIKLVSKKGIKIIHFFSPAEKDANFLYLVLKKISNVHIYKHPSPGALIAHNQFLMTDTLVLSSHYQKEEYQLQLNKTISCQAIEFWPPENSKSYLDFYKNNKKEPNFKIGFYSHGGWLRKQTNLSNALFANPSDEEECLKVVIAFIKKHHLPLKIYLHPKEKQNIEKTKSYYFNFLNKEEFEFYTEHLNSSFDFQSVEYGIGAYSAILFERDYCGFKTLVWREKQGKFPLLGTAFYKNSFDNINELTNKITYL